VEQELLSKIVASLDFSESAIDSKRIAVLVAYQGQTGHPTRAELATKFADNLEPPAKAADASVTRALSTLVTLRPDFFQPDQLGDLATRLVAQLKAAHDKLKSIWASPLLYFLASLPPDARSDLEEIIAQMISGPADPAVLPDFLREIGPQNCTLLLSIPAIRTAVHTQAKYLEKFGAAKASSYRQEFLEPLAPTDILGTDLFDEARLWDLANLLRAFKRAAALEQVDLQHVRSRLTKFCAEHVLGSLPDSQELYDQAYEEVTRESKLLDETVADVLCRCALKLLSTDLKTYYPQFRTWKSGLATQTRTELIREAVSALQSDGDQWISGLELISEDVANDEALRADQILVRDLFDHAFAAVEEEGVDALDPALNLLAFLSDQQLRDYVDRALDTLITYEAGREPLDRMEPFFRLLESPAARLTGDDLGKVARFCRRLLGPANDPAEQTRALQFISTLKRVELVQELRGELEQLTGSEDEQIAGHAKKILGPAQEGQD
jgi:hypothetical protein